MGRPVLFWYVQQPVLNKDFPYVFSSLLQSTWLPLKDKVLHSGLGPGAAEMGPLPNVTSTEEKILSRGRRGSAATLPSFLSPSWCNQGQRLCSPSVAMRKYLQLRRLRDAKAGTWARIADMLLAVKFMAPQIILDVSFRYWKGKIKPKPPDENTLGKEWKVALHEPH